MNFPVYEESGVAACGNHPPAAAPAGIVVVQCKQEIPLATAVVKES